LAAIILLFAEGGVLLHTEAPFFLVLGLLVPLK
jgi:hypothetical protein